MDRLVQAIKTSNTPAEESKTDQKPFQSNHLFGRWSDMNSLFAFRLGNQFD